MASSAFPSVDGYVLTERIGSGTYAVVYKAFHKAGKREVVAVKCVEISSLSKVATENLLTEISLLKKLKHEYIVEMIDFQWTAKQIFIIMEYCSGGDLSTFIKSKRSLPENVVKRFLQQIAIALKFLRAQNISHLDLKPQNILLTSRYEPVLKLGDFGFAQFLKPKQDCYSLRGSPLYMAPEILLQQKYDARVDLWSVGVILYECLFGRAPYSSKTFAELAEKIKNPSPIEIPYGVRISQNCRHLILNLLQRDPQKRIDYREFFDHPFIDLEHAPSSLSYAKAVDLLADAVKEDESNNFSQAILFYCDGLQHLVAAIEYEKCQNKKDAMRNKARQYMARAEHLKQMMKPQRQNSVDKSPLEELIILSEDCATLHAALVVGTSAENLEREEKFSEALDKYCLALDAMLSQLQDEPLGKRRDLLSSQIRLWMQRGETIKRFLAIKTIPNEEEGGTGDNENNSSETRQQCNLQ